MPAFADVIAPESFVVRQIRRVLLGIACLYALSFCWSIFRRLRQVLVIEARSSSLTLAPGVRVGYHVITSGEASNRIRLELLQGAECEVLFEQRANVNRVSGLDPRVFEYSPTITLTPALLAPFHAGPATLRVTGFGGQKLLHIPASRVADAHVRIER